MKLHLGVIETAEPEEGETTYTVGKTLERTYGLFSLMASNYETFIADTIGEDAAQGLEDIMNGQSVSVEKVFARSGQEITTKMHDFITTQEVERVAAKYGEHGIPTQAALDGLSLRTARGKTISRVRKDNKFKVVKGARRPSFIYSGIFEKSLVAWVE